MAEHERLATPPPRENASNQSIQLTPEQVKRMEINRLKAKARLSEKQGNSLPQDSSSAGVKRGDGALEKIQPARKFAKYIDYDFSKMKDTKGGFIADENASLPEGKQYEPKRVYEHSISIDPSQNAKCFKCGTPELDFRFLEVFGCRVCQNCKEKFPDKYSLLTKTECRNDYLLTDPELRDGELLPHLEKPNPHKNTWNNMMLYLRYQVEEFAAKKWGSLDKLDDEFTRREKEKKDKKVKKFAQKLAELKKKTRVATWKKTPVTSKHEHIWSEPLDSEGGSSIRICQDCGMETEEIVF